ncbi:flagellar filament capping protein FliD [Novosphingobium sp. FSY-8]|uniref:Flagellar hook-associated protein 2 n=1 Tax=Novosphingobium ovatum TaxID=1908523 RepID=A0ABW9XGB8_9SPHN|nr:flagellar filament capping protein FliD [Novosphingobium ovatum]NBC37523.1 flagellar filament capping protein FliD [Novosphingobium ovatum]
MSTTTSSTSSTTTTTTTSTSSASVGSKLLTSLGVGTGIDMTEMATNIATAEYAAQNDAVTTRLSNLKLQISEAGQLKSDLLSLSSSLSSLIDSGGLLPAPTVTNSNVATASLPTGSSGTKGSYTLEVTQLAKPQVLTTGTFTSATSTLKPGTLTFSFGTFTGATLGTPTSTNTLTVADGDTVSSIVSKINNANMGVTAYLATNADGVQIVMKGTEGAAKAFTITANNTDDGSSTSAYSVATMAYSGATGGVVTRAQSSTDAAYKLDGISRTATTNTIDSAAPGLSLKLTGTNIGSPTTVTYSDPSSSITTTMTNLVSALNSLVTEMNTVGSADTGHLNGDAGIKTMKRAFSALAGTTIMPNAATGEPATLADLGLKTNRDGSFSLDTAKLASALSSNTSAVAAMFTKGIHGVYATVFSTVSSLTTSSDSSSLAGSITRYTALQTRVAAQQTNLSTQETKLRERLITQYSASNAAVATFNSTLSYLKNQIAAWNKTSS